MRPVFISFSLVSFALLLTIESIAQSVPNMVNYQGRLTDQSGSPLAAGTYTIQLRLWDSPTPAGANDFIWGQQQTVAIQTNGVFNVLLGAPGATAITVPTPAVNDLTFAFTATNRYLGVTVAAENGVTIANPSEILPRQELLSVPYAIQAQQAQQAQIASSLIANLQNALCPPGTIVAFGGTVVPAGWFLCDGSTVNRNIYTNLFITVGTSWGMGDGVTTFNLPDLRGIFLRGVNGSRNDSFADPDNNASRINIFNGGNSGNNVGSYEPDQFKSHNHLIGMANDGASITYNIQLGSGGNTFKFTSSGVQGTYNGGNGSYFSGGNETRPKNAYVNYIIKY